MQLASTAIPWRSEELESEMHFSRACEQRGWGKTRVLEEILKGTAWVEGECDVVLQGHPKAGQNSWEW